MKEIEHVEIAEIQSHLQRKGSGVSLDLTSMPGNPDEYLGFKGLLEEIDIDRLILWFEFEMRTREQNCRVKDLLPSAMELQRVASFIVGDSQRELTPLDLNTVQGMEIVVVTDDVKSGFLYIIDGNHRAIAQITRGKSFQGVRVFACQHSKMRNWAYIPRFYKKLWSS